MKLVSLFLLASILLVTSFGKPPADIQSRLDAYVGNAPGGIAVAWVDADGVAFFSAGNYTADDGQPITSDTQFEIGSISKTFNGLLLAESINAGKVALTDSAASHLLPQDDPAQASLAKITLLSLVTHYSGLPRLPFNIGANPDGNADPYADYNRDDLIEALRQHGPTAPVGLTFAYSNYGAAVLGEALANAWGATYEEALQTHVLTPLGMKETSLAMMGRTAPAGLAPGHAGAAQTGNWHFKVFAPAGALLSSPRDLSLFLQAALGYADSPLNASLTESTKPQMPVESMGGDVGLGWLLAKDGDQSAAWHNRGTGGYRSFLGFSRTSGKGIAVLTNRSTSVDKLGFDLLGISPSRPQVAGIKDASSYTGSYPLPSPSISLKLKAT